MKQRTPKRTSQARTAAVPRQRVYLDSTIPSVYPDDREGNRYETDVTRRWSRGESARSKSGFRPRRWRNWRTAIIRTRRRFWNSTAPILDLLPPDVAVDALAQAYVENLVMPRKHLGDAWHLAYATFHGFEFLLTWNCNHLANANKRRHLETINWRLGFETPQIVTPLELFKERDDV